MTPAPRSPALSSLPARPAADVAAGFVPVQFPLNADAPIHLELRKGTALVTVDWPTSLGPVLNYRTSSMPNGSLVKKVIYSQ